MRRKLLIGGAVLAIAAIGFGIPPLVIPVPGPLAVALLVLALTTGLLAGVAIVFAIVVPRFGSDDSFRAGAVAAATANGRTCLARVLSVRPTGARLNGAYAYDVDLVVAATDIPAYQSNDRIRVHRTEGRLEPGQILTVVRLHADRPGVAVTGGPSATDQSAAIPESAPQWPSAG